MCVYFYLIKIQALLRIHIYMEIEVRLATWSFVFFMRGFMSRIFYYIKYMASCDQTTSKHPPLAGVLVLSLLIIFLKMQNKKGLFRSVFAKKCVIGVLFET